MSQSHLLPIAQLETKMLFQCIFVGKVKCIGELVNPLTIRCNLLPPPSPGRGKGERYREKDGMSVPGGAW